MLWGVGGGRDRGVLDAARGCGEAAGREKEGRRKGSGEARESSSCRVEREE